MPRPDDRRVRDRPSGRKVVDPGRVRQDRGHGSGNLSTMTTNQPRSGPDRPGIVLSVLGMIGVALHLQPVPLLELLALIPAGILLLMGLRRSALQDAARSTWRH